MVIYIEDKEEGASSSLGLVPIFASIFRNRLGVGWSVLAGGTRMSGGAWSGTRMSGSGGWDPHVRWGLGWDPHVRWGLGWDPQIGRAHV